MYHAASEDTLVVVFQIGHGVFECLHELRFFQGPVVVVRQDLVEDVETIFRLYEVQACHWPRDAALRTQCGESLIAGDFKDPGTKVGADLVEVALEEDFHEGLLGNVLREPFVSDDAPDQLTHLAAVSPLDDGEAFFDMLTLIDRGHQLIVRELVAWGRGLYFGLGVHGGWTTLNCHARTQFRIVGIS